MYMYMQCSQVTGLDDKQVLINMNVGQNICKSYEMQDIFSLTGTALPIATGTLLSPYFILQL